MQVVHAEALFAWQLQTAILPSRSQRHQGMPKPPPTSRDHRFHHLHRHQSGQAHVHLGVRSVVVSHVLFSLHMNVALAGVSLDVAVAAGVAAVVVVSLDVAAVAAMAWVSLNLAVVD